MASKAMPKTGRPRRLLLDQKYRERVTVFAMHPDLFNVSEVARFLGISRHTAMDDMRDSLSLKKEDLIR